MTVLTGIIISAVVIGLTVLFILWVLKRYKCDASESLGSKLWAYEESDISGNQLDRMRHMDDYFKHTNVKPRNMLIFAAAFICISILFIVFYSILLATPTQRKSESTSGQVSYGNEDPEKEAFVERMQATYDKYKKPTAYQNPKKTVAIQKGKILSAQSVFGEKEGNGIEIELARFAIVPPEEWAVNDDEELADLTSASYGDKAASNEEILKKTKKFGVKTIYGAYSEDLTEMITIVVQYAGKELVDVSDPEMICIQELSNLEQILNETGADKVDVCMDGVPFRGIQWPCVRMSYTMGGMDFYAAIIPIIEDEYVYKLSLQSDSEATLDNMISSYIQSLK